MNPIAAHASIALAGILLWWVYAGGEDQRGQSIGAFVGGLSLLVATVLGMVMFAALRGGFGSERRPAKGRLSRGVILLHGVGALVTLVIVVIELPDAWRRYSGDAPSVKPESDTSVLVLLPAWVGAGVVVSLVARVVLRKKAEASTSLGTDLALGGVAGTVAGLIGYYAASLSTPITVLAAGFGALFLWWWRVVSFAGVDVEDSGSAAA